MLVKMSRFAKSAAGQTRSRPAGVRRLAALPAWSRGPWASRLSLDSRLWSGNPLRPLPRSGRSWQSFRERPARWRRRRRRWRRGRERKWETTDGSWTFSQWNFLDLWMGGTTGIGRRPNFSAKNWHRGWTRCQLRFASRSQLALTGGQSVMGLTGQPCRRRRRGKRPSERCRCLRCRG